MSTAFLSVALLKWIGKQGIECALLNPGKPWQSGTTESFKGKFRGECPAMEWFRNRLEGWVVIENWRPHSRLNYETLETFSKNSATP